MAATWCKSQIHLEERIGLSRNLHSQARELQRRPTHGSAGVTAAAIHREQERKPVESTCSEPLRRTPRFPVAVASARVPMLRLIAERLTKREEPATTEPMPWINSRSPAFARPERRGAQRRVPGVIGVKRARERVRRQAVLPRPRRRPMRSRRRGVISDRHALLRGASPSISDSDLLELLLGARLEAHHEERAACSTRGSGPSRRRTGPGRRRQSMTLYFAPKCFFASSTMPNFRSSGQSTRISGVETKSRNVGQHLADALPGVGDDSKQPRRAVHRVVEAVETFCEEHVTRHLAGNRARGSRASSLRSASARSSTSPACRPLSRLPPAAPASISRRR